VRFGMGWVKAAASNSTGNCLEARWTHASASSIGDCVEVQAADGGVLVRDSKDPHGPVLEFTESEWRAFLDGAKKGEFDLDEDSAPTAVA
jgi:hypothetical protein